ncbi:MAG: NAD(P)H-hydrate dehydratase [Tenuifilaceae bacterium]
MKIFLANQIREIDRFTIEKEPISSIDLMERAADAICKWFAEFISSEKKILLYAGPGNNGGDGLALARMLVELGYWVEVYILTSDSYSADFQKNLKRLESQSSIKPTIINCEADIPEISINTVVVDALYGSGLTRPLEGLSEMIVKSINTCQSTVISIDIPSGLFCDENPIPNTNPVVCANFTLSLQFPKLSQLFAENSRFVGNLELLPIGLHPKAIESTYTPYTFIDYEFASSLLKPREIFSHKGDYGHCLVIAGSFGMMGAAILSTSACIRTGAGLVTAHTPRLGYKIIQQTVPEAMVDIDDNDWNFSGIESLTKYSAILVGPGLGKSFQSEKGVRELFKIINVPILIDADALNIISENIDLLDLLPTNTVITPHPGEFDRLFGKSDCSYQRFNLAREKAKHYGIVIVLKGAHTQVICPNGDVSFNSTGNPGMATGGSGDVLSGIITSFLGQGYDPKTASILGVYLHGLAGDIASEETGLNSLKASDIVNYLCNAFKFLEK